MADRRLVCGVSMGLTGLTVLEDEVAPSTPSSLVVRYGFMRMLGEFPYDGDRRPSCGSTVVLRSRRGTELATVLATTCANSGCPTAISREVMEGYIAESGAGEFPFTTEGRILRIATPEDHQEHARIDGERARYVRTGRELVREMDLPMKLIDVELLLGGEMATFYFLSEHRIDFRALVKQLAGQFRTRIQMHQVGSRDEARLVADFETCGQHCCCRQFLKILRPVNMGSAKMQKATLDPSKISGRCGRLKCCLRYEEQTYEQLRRLLPRVGSRVRTPEGEGVVLETVILTQLIKVRLENEQIVALANEELLERDLPPAPARTLDRVEPAPEERRGARRPSAVRPPPQSPRTDQALNELPGLPPLPHEPAENHSDGNGNGKDTPAQPSAAGPPQPVSGPEGRLPAGGGRRRRRRGRGR